VIDRSRIRPSLAWLGLAALPPIAGIAVAVVVLLALLDDVTGGFKALTGPVSVRLADGEGRGIWADDGQSVSGFCSATGPARAEMKRTSGVTVTSGGTEYHSFLRFRAPKSGKYRVECAASRPLSVGPYITGGRIFAGVAGILGAFFGGLLLGALVVPLILIARERSTRRLELEAQASWTSAPRQQD
jgi:hypothetical protein